MPEEIYLRGANLFLGWQKYEVRAAESLNKCENAEHVVRRARLKNDDVIKVRHNTLKAFNIL